MLQPASSMNRYHSGLTRWGIIVIVAGLLGSIPINAQNQIVDYENRLFDTLKASRDGGANTVSIYPRRIDTVTLGGPGPLKFIFGDGSSIYETDMKGYKPGYSSHVKVYFDTSLYSIDYLDTPTPIKQVSTNSQNSASQTSGSGTGGTDSGGSGGSGVNGGTNSTLKSTSGFSTNSPSTKRPTGTNRLVRVKPTPKMLGTQTNTPPEGQAKTLETDPSYGIVYVTPTNTGAGSTGNPTTKVFNHGPPPIQARKKSNRDIYIGSGVIVAIIAGLIFRRRKQAESQSQTDTPSTDEK